MIASLFIFLSANLLTFPIPTQEVFKEKNLIKSRYFKNLEPIIKKNNKFKITYQKTPMLIEK